jgi:hypothetical protein
VELLKLSVLVMGREGVNAGHPERFLEVGPSANLLREDGADLNYRSIQDVLTRCGRAALKLRQSYYPSE